MSGIGIFFSEGFSLYFFPIVWPSVWWVLLMGLYNSVLVTCSCVFKMNICLGFSVEALSSFYWCLFVNVKNTTSILCLSAQSCTADNQVLVDFVHSLYHTHSISDRWSDLCLPVSCFIAWSDLSNVVSVQQIRHTKYVCLEQQFFLCLLNPFLFKYFFNLKILLFPALSDWKHSELFP